MAYILDAGALIAVDRLDPRVVALLAVAVADRTPIRAPATVIAQVLRDGARQARLSRLLHAVAETPLDSIRSRAVGELLRTSGTTDVVDASVIELTRHGDVVLTADIADLSGLASAAGKRLQFVAV